MGYNKTVLPNGTRVVTEKVPNVYSISLGLCITRGSIDETVEENGLSHFLEHLFFKGTTSRTAKDIAVEVDSIGGELNAFTSREFTYFYAKFIDEHLQKVWHLIADILTNSKFGMEEIELERNVILEEIKSFNDSPTDQALHLLSSCLFSPHPISYSIMGPEENIKRFNRTDILNFRSRHYKGNNLIIGGAGNIEHSVLLELVASLNFLTGNESHKANQYPQNTLKYKYLKKSDISQSHIAIGTRIVGYRSELRYTWLLLNTLLGNGMSSRLFQRLREKEGLVYEVVSFLELLQEIGIFGVYFVTDPKNVNSAMDCIWDEFKSLLQNKLEPGELERTKGQLKGSLLLSLESTNTRMTRLLNNEKHLGRYVSVEETINNIDKVMPDDILSLAQSYLIPDIYSTSKVGPEG